MLSYLEKIQVSYALGIELTRNPRSTTIEAQKLKRKTEYIIKKFKGRHVMVSAIIMGKVEAGKDKDVLEKIKDVNGVEHACATYGIYDIVVRVHFQSVEALDKFVFHDLRSIPSVKETVTLVCSSFVT